MAALLTKAAGACQYYSRSIRSLIIPRGQNLMRKIVGLVVAVFCVHLFAATVRSADPARSPSNSAFRIWKPAWVMRRAALTPPMLA